MKNCLNTSMAPGLVACAVVIAGAAAGHDGRHHDERTGAVTSSPSISVSTSVRADGVRQGETIIISWQSTDAPDGSAVGLWPMKAVTGRIFDAIASGLPVAGSHPWQIPVFEMPPIACAPDITGGCVGSMNPDTTYRIVAWLYTPSDASVAERGPGKVHPAVVALAESAVFAMLPATGR
jgi:hypothetical protein